MAITRTITIGDKKKKPSAKKEPVFKRKRNADGKTLVIVESPAKAKTIERILGSGYKVLASMGHLRDLPEKTFGVDIAHDFTPEYVNSVKRADVIKNLQKEANRSKDILLATDPDREGEAISWHLSKLLDVNPDDNVRIAFHEITPPAIKDAVKHPGPVDLSMVNAQQARRVLDRIVGYKLSPWLWKQIYRGLSAGRVQSVATRLICEREEEIRAFTPVEYWTVEGTFKTEEKEKFKAKLVQIAGKEAELHTKEETDRVVQALLKKPADIISVTKSKKQRKAKPPYTTSTMQQDAVNRLSFGSKKTMMLAQMLYEGVEIPGHGHIGLITYMRTDSTRISAEMIQQIRPYIMSVYGEEYLPAKPNVYSKKKEAQDAHEAIRPTNLEFPPDTLKAILSRDQLRLYTLIWNRFVASQMAPQISQATTATLQNGEYTLRASGSTVLFDGFTVMQPAKEKKQENEDFTTLPPLRKGESVMNVKMEGEQHFTTPPPRYTEASLIKTLEEKGIGRPSTYAPILDTIQKRNYVEKEGKQFVPTDLGFKVTNLLKQYFAGIINVDFTAELETWLDKIAEGKATYENAIREFWNVFEKELNEANEKAAKAKEDNQEVSDVLCEKCGAPMIVKMSRYGKYLACPNFPECKNTKPYGKGDGKEEVSGIPCDECGEKMVYRQGPYGRYLKCPGCGANKAIVVDTGIVCPKCHEGHLVRRRSRRGRYFYGCNQYPRCDMALWDEPIDQFCDTCGAIMVKKTYKNKGEKILCSNPECPTHPKKKKPAGEDSGKSGVKRRGKKTGESN